MTTALAVTAACVLLAAAGVAIGSAAATVFYERVWLPAICGED